MAGGLKPFFCYPAILNRQMFQRQHFYSLLSPLTFLVAPYLCNRTCQIRASCVLCFIVPLRNHCSQNSHALYHDASSIKYAKIPIFHHAWYLLFLWFSTYFVVVVVVYLILSRLLYLAYSANLGLLCMPHPGMGPLV